MIAQNHIALRATQNQRDACLLQGLIYTHSKIPNCSTTSVTESPIHQILSKLSNGLRADNRLAGSRKEGVPPPPPSTVSLKFPSSELPEIWGFVTGFPRGQYYTGRRLSSAPLKPTLVLVFKNCFWRAFHMILHVLFLQLEDKKFYTFDLN